MIIAKQLMGIGWIGTLCILTAYCLNIFGILPVTNLWYPLLNIIGAVGMIVNNWEERDYPTIFLNAFWFLVAAISLFNIWF